MLGEALSAVREPSCDSETGSPQSAILRRFRTCTASEGTKKSRSRRGRAVDSGWRSERSFRGFYFFSDELADYEPLRFDVSFWRGP